MQRRKFLAAATAATALGVAGCTQEPGERDGSADTKATPGDGGPGSQPEGTDDVTETDTPGAETPANEGDSAGGESGQAWGSGGQMGGVPYTFSSRGPEAGENRDEVDIRFDTAAGEVVVDGTISGSDSCKRATLGSLSYDESAGTLAVGVETTDIEDCDVGAQVLVGIDYEGTFEFDGDLPSEVTVSHDGQAIAGAAHESSSAAATARPRTTSE